MPLTARHGGLFSVGFSLWVLQLCDVWTQKGIITTIIISRQWSSFNTQIAPGGDNNNLLDVLRTWLCRSPALSWLPELICCHFSLSTYFWSGSGTLVPIWENLIVKHSMVFETTVCFWVYGHSLGMALSCFNMSVQSYCQIKRFILDNSAKTELFNFSVTTHEKFFLSAISAYNNYNSAKRMVQHFGICLLTLKLLQAAF